MKRKPLLAALAAAVVLAGGGTVAAAALGDDGDGSASTASGTGTGPAARQGAGLPRTGAADDTDAHRDDDQDDDRARRDDDDQDDDRGEDARERAQDAAEHRAEAATARKLAAPDALAAALAHTPGRAVSAEVDENHGGRLVWEIEIIDRSGALRHVDVSPSSGKVLGAHAERGESDDVRAAQNLLRGDATSAVEAARAAAAKGTVVSVDLEEEGEGYWSVETGTGEAEWSVSLDGAKLTHEADD